MLDGFDREGYPVPGAHLAKLMRKVRFDGSFFDSQRQPDLFV
jgi:hypothetical protein